MKSTPLTTLKSSLSKYIKRVKAGEEVLVTERGRPVAKIVPVEKEGADYLADMEKQGLIKRGSGRIPKAYWQITAPSDNKGAGLKYLLEEREDNR